MTAYASSSERRFVRDGDHAVLGGVCAGIANYFGFNRCAVRTIVIISFFLFMPFVALAYIALVLLVPSESSQYEYVIEREVRRRRRRRMTRRERRRARAEEEAREQERAADAIRERYRSMNERLAKIEKYVTSSRYDLDREFRDL